MPCRLTRKEVVSIQVLSEKGVPKRQIAREMQVAESTVRYHVRRGEDGALDGRSGKGKKADELAGPIEAWVVERRRDARPANLKDLHEHLVAEHGYGGSYKSVVRWVRCHNESFQRLGGVPATNRVDNEKTAVCRGAGAWGTITPAYAAYARSMRFHVDACQPRQPQAKGKTESKVRLARQLGPKRKVYDSLEELQAESDASLEGWAKKRRCPVTGKLVWDTWQDELAHLQPLPAVMPEPFDTVVQREVQRDGLVNFEGRQYAVPFAKAGLVVEVRGCADKVQIYHGDALLKEYARGTRALLLMDPSCYEGPGDERVLAPQPLGKMGRRLQEIYEMPVEQRPLDLYAALSEVAR